MVQMYKFHQGLRIYDQLQVRIIKQNKKRAVKQSDRQTQTSTYEHMSIGSLCCLGHASLMQNLFFGFKISQGQELTSTGKVKYFTVPTNQFRHIHTNIHTVNLNLQNPVLHTLEVYLGLARTVVWDYSQRVAEVEGEIVNQCLFTQQGPHPIAYVPHKLPSTLEIHFNKTSDSLISEFRIRFNLFLCKSV